MKEQLEIEVDSAKPDMGVSDLIEEFRDLYEQPNGRQRIAERMTQVLERRTRINRQMVEKWFRKGQRTLPSSPLFVALLVACKQLTKETDDNE